MSVLTSYHADGLRVSAIDGNAWPDTDPKRYGYRLHGK